MSSDSHRNQNMPSQRITVSNRTIIRVIALIVASILVLKVLGKLDHVLTLIFVSFFMALALNPAVSWIAGHLKSRSRVRATGLAYIVVLSLVIGFFALVLPPLFRQTTAFISNLPQTVANLQSENSSFAHFIRDHNLQGTLQSMSQQFSAAAPKLQGHVVSTATKIGTTIVSILVVIVMTFMMLVEGPRWLNKFWGLYAAEGRERHRALVLKMYRAVTSYVNGQLLIALIAAGFACLAMLVSSTIYEVNINVIALTSIVLIGGLIPMIGNTIAASIIVFVCLFSSLPLAVTLLIYFIIYWQVENYTLQPYIQSRQSELTPLLVFVAALIGVAIDGLLGALIAIPVTSCIKILADDYISRRKLDSETA